MQRRIVWCDAEANFNNLNNQDSVERLIKNAIRCNIDTLIIDVKPLAGEVLYNSKIAPRFKGSNESIYPDSFDLLKCAIDKGHEAGLKIHAGINIFCEGHRKWGRGPAYDNIDWQTVSLEPVRILTIDKNYSITINHFDPWSIVDQPVIYTRKSGTEIKPNPDKDYIIIKDNQILSVISNSQTPIGIPESGCILSISNNHSIPIKISSEINWQVNHILRKSEESLIPSWGIFINPIGTGKSHQLAIIDEIVSEYDIDGITFDRMRYQNIYTDFSKDSMRLFGEWLNANRDIHPEDIIIFQPDPWKPYIRGKLFKEWLEWRSRQIKNFAVEAIELIKSKNKCIETGVYVGSWYESYYDVGVNWGSTDNNIKYEWMTQNYYETGYAELFDYICTGCYYKYVTKDDAKQYNKPEGATVEAGCDLSISAINQSSKIFGSLYLLEYKNDPLNFIKAIDIVSQKTNGFMLFDLIYLDDYNWWNLLNEN